MVSGSTCSTGVTILFLTGPQRANGEQGTLAWKRMEAICGRRRQKKRTPFAYGNVDLLEPDLLVQVSSASMVGAPHRQPTSASAPMKSRVSPTGSYLFRVQKKRDL